MSDAATSQNTDPQKQIIKAAKSGDTPAVRALIAVDPLLVNATDTDGSTPLHCAAWKGHLEVAALRLEAGADVQAKNHNSHWGDTPLHAAAHGNRSAVAKLLLERGADNQSKNASGNSPLKETEAHGATAVANLLKSYGATRD